MTATSPESLRSSPRAGGPPARTDTIADLLAHPLVDDIAVLGQPDALRGEVVCAVVRRTGLAKVAKSELAQRIAGGTR